MSPALAVLSSRESPELQTDVLVRHLTQAAAGLDLFQRVVAARDAVTGPLVFTTGFGIEGQAINHAIFTQNLDIDVVTLDTGRLFSETHDVWAETERRYGRTIRAIVPDRRELEALIDRQGSNGFKASIDARQSCCHVRKVAPLKHALAGAVGWITGLRADQSRHRAGVTFADVDAARGVIKINPLFDWTREQAIAFVRDHDVPINALHERGFASVGCAPCTRAVQPGEPERAGRWWWETEGKTECGLHANPLHLAARTKLTVAQS